MAKCVVCTHLNAIEEQKKHPNAQNEAMVKMLFTRRRNASPKVHPNKFCPKHGVSAGVVMTGKPTGQFAQAGA